MPTELVGEVVAEAQPLLGGAVPVVLLSFEHESLLQRCAVKGFLAHELDLRAASHRHTNLYQGVAVVV